jgi:DNA polymerase I-like protein with 3'-5' exonuclease and polymerase domains
MMVTVIEARTVGQMQLFGCTDTINSNILFPGDSRWWETMEVWSRSAAIAYDTETYSTARGKKAALNPWKNSPRLFQVGVQMPDKSVRVMMVDTDQHPNYKESQYFKLLTHFMTSPDRWVIMQNGMFDLLCWRVWYGIRPRCIFDTFIASNLQWAGLPVKHSLGAQCDRYGIEIDKSEQSSDWGAPVLSAAQINYAARDVEVLFPLAEKYHRYLTIQGQSEVMWVEMRFLCALVEMEFNGLPVDTEMLSTYRAQYQEAYDRYYAEVNQVWKSHSPPVMGVVVQRSDLQVDSKTLTQQFVHEVTGQKVAKADKQILLQLGEQHPILKKLSLCRTLKISLDKFDAIDKAKRKHPTGLWVVSGAFKQFSKSAGDDDGTGGDDAYGAGTGRTGSGSGSRGAYLAPNLQNIPTQSKLPDDIKALGLRSIRECFRVPSFGFAPHPGCFYIHDLAAAHARIAAYLSGDKLMKEIYDTDVDAHAITVTKLIKYLEDFDAATMTVNPEDVKLANKMKKHPDITWLQKLLIRLRDVGKNFYYGCLNDGGAFVLYRLFQSSGLNISMENCEAALEEYFKLYEGLGTFLQSIRDACEIPPVDLPETYKTLKPRSQKSAWFKFGDAYYYKVQSRPGTLLGRRVSRKVRIKPMKAGGDIALGPKPADVLSAIWLGTEATAMKQAAAIVYEWHVEHPEVEFYLGGIVHDELDGWSLTPQPESARVMIGAMDNCFGNLIAPIPAGPVTRYDQIIVNSWSDK